MADRSGGLGSTLANVAAKARQVQRTRELLNLGERGAPQPQRTVPPRAPADTRAPQRAPQPAAEGTPEDRQAALVQRTREFLGQMKTGGMAPAPEEPGFRPMTEKQRPAGEALAEVGAQAVRPEIAFFRLAGRPPSPKELAIFQARIELERQLGRPPTRTEMKLYISRPEAISPAHPRAFELGE